MFADGGGTVDLSATLTVDMTKFTGQRQQRRAQTYY